MRKLLFITFLFCFMYTRSNGQKPATPVQITKTEINSFTDIKPIVSIANPDKDFTLYQVNSFTLSGSYTDSGNSISFIESSSCGTLTEKQRSVIEKYGKQGMVFSLEGISLMKQGIPGTPYHPEEEISISVPTILFTIKE